MTEFVYVRPAHGGRVRMPDRGGRVMSEEGAMVPRIDYYERLLISGDIAISEQPKAAPPPLEPQLQAPAENTVEEPRRKPR